VTAEPEPSLIWFFNDQPLSAGPRVHLSYGKTSTTLTLESAVVQDTGDYTCRATNALGDASTKTFLRVRRTSAHAVTAFYNNSNSKLVAWHSGRTSVSDWRTFPVLRLTCS